MARHTGHRPARVTNINNAHVLAALLLLARVATAPAAAGAPHPRADSIAVVTATRVARPPVIDGRLDDPAWRAAAPITAFSQAVPVEGAAPSESTIVRIVYDDRALYVAARMVEHDTTRIRAMLTRRDAGSPSDWFAIALDTYHDHRTAMRFQVNPAGVRSDELHANDNRWGDGSWDPVWQVATRIDARGWTAELEIPMSQLRFRDAAVQVWGVELERYSSDRRETDEMVLIRQTEVGYASRFAELVGIHDVPAPRRLELRPYASGRLRTAPAAPGDPFFDGRQASASGGLDAQYGLTPGLTLDATINPDFAQVEADPAQLNLTAFETYQSERRPFFVEGAQIFGFGPSPGSMFYSRRIGRAPSLAPDASAVTADDADSTLGPFTDVPDHTTILGAAKVSGQLAQGTSVGILHAETAREMGRVFARNFGPAGASDAWGREEVEPRAHYTVARVKQNLRDGETTIGLLLTRTQRDLDTPRLDSLLRDRAYTGGVDFDNRWHEGRFDVGGSVGWSYIHGSPTAITGAQRASARYYQRPDQDYVHLDSTRTSLGGYAAETRLSYNGAGGVYAGLGGSLVTPGFELNDLGFLTTADDRSVNANVGWSTPAPGPTWAQYGGGISAYRHWNSGGTLLGSSYSAHLSAFTHAGWGTNVSAWVSPRGLSQTATRGGPMLLTGSGWGGSFFITTDYRKPLALDASVYTNRGEFGDRGTGGDAMVHWRPATNVEVGLGPNVSSQHSSAWYVAAQPDTLAAATYGTRYVFGALDQRSLGITTRADLTFTPSLSFQMYAQAFAGSGIYSQLGELRAPGTFDFLRYGVDDGSAIAREAGGGYVIDPDGAAGPAAPFDVADPDASYRALQGTAVLRWEYSPGATLYAVWTQARSTSDQSGAARVGQLGELFGLPMENVFLVKVDYWLSR